MRNREGQIHCYSFPMELLTVSPQQQKFQSLGFQCKWINSENELTLRVLYFSEKLLCACAHAQKEWKVSKKNQRSLKTNKTQILSGNFFYHDHVWSTVILKLFKMVNVVYLREYRGSLLHF